MVYTRRYQTALGTINTWIRAGNHYTELQEYLKLLGWEQKVIRERAATFRKEFEDAAGITKVKSDMQVDESEQGANTPELIVSASLFHESILAEQDLSKEMKIAFDGLRDSDRFKRMLDQRDVLAIELKAARAECFTREDHPLIAARKNPKEWNLTLMDEQNFDLAAAKTLEQKSEVEQNLRNLEADEADTKSRDVTDEAAWQKRIGEGHQKQEQLGYLNEP